MIQPARPWRAVAYVYVPGLSAKVMGRTSATRRRGLDRFTRRHADAGHTVVVWRILPLPDPPT